jgi:hypothetical protein
MPTREGLLTAHKTLILAAATLALAACNPFHRSPSVEVSDEDENRYTRWHGTFTSPASLAGVVQMTGSATMAPGNDARSTRVMVELSNATPGGEHPWALHRGHCDSAEELLGQRSDYEPIKVDNDGRATASANVDMHTPTSGSYSVRVTASPSNTRMVLACANLAPPSM